MKVPFVHGPGDLRLEEVEAPTAGPRDVVLRVASVGICGSDLGFVAMGGLSGPTDKPFPLGHELSGTVLEAGSEVTSVAVGDRVVVNPLINLVGNGATEGGFAERLLVRDVAGQPQSLLPLADGISMDVGALVEPLSVATHAVNQLAAKPGDKVAIFGGGPIGLASLVVLRHRGFTDIALFDLSPFRRDRATELGATAFDPQSEPAVEALTALHGSTKLFGRIDMPATTHFIEATGAPVIPEIMKVMRAGATLCVVSLQKKPVTVDFAGIMSRELKIVGAMGYPNEFADVLEMLADGSVDLAPLVSHRFAGEDFMEAFETAKQPDAAAKVLVQYDRD